MISGSAISRFLAGKILRKIDVQYKRLHNKTLRKIIVTGTAGKSSQTLMLKQLFSNNGWVVFTGVDEQGKSLNSLTGLIMVLADFRVDFESKIVIFDKLLFICKSLWFWFFESYPEIPEKTIIIHEVGFDHQDESKDVYAIFRDGIDIVITTSATYEHSVGFSDQLNHRIFSLIKDTIPHKWLPVFEDDGLDTLLKNITLEQLSLLPLASAYSIPASVGVIDNWVMDTFEGSVQTHHVKAERGKNFALVADGTMTFPDSYLLPMSFARSAYVTQRVAQYFEISEDAVIETIKNIKLPNGRFRLLDGMLDTTLVDSTYNSDPQSMETYLDLFEEVLVAGTRYDQIHLLSTQLKERAGEAPKHYLVFGEMRELGDTSVNAHKQILDRLIEMGKQWGPYIENVLLLGQEWIKCDDDGVVKMQDHVSFITYRKQLFKVFMKAGDIKAVLNEDTIRPQSWLWFKGSQNTIYLELIVEHLLANKNDVELLCRRGKSWDEKRRIYA